MNYKWKIYSEDDLADAISVLVRALKKDDNYRMTWQANIAMAFQDEFHRSHRHCGVHEMSNEAAKNFLSNLMREK